MAISLILVDDHPLFRKGLLHLLENHTEITVSAQFADATSVREWLNGGGRARIALLDRTLGEEDGLSLVPSLRQQGIKTIMLTMAEEDYEIRDAMEKGVDGYLLKSSDPDQIIQTIIAVSQGNSVFPSHILQKMARGELGPSRASKLSNRELEIVSYVAQGLSNRAIGDTLDSLRIPYAIICAVSWKNWISITGCKWRRLRWSMVWQSAPRVVSRKRLLLLGAMDYSCSKLMLY